MNVKPECKFAITSCIKMYPIIDLFTNVSQIYGCFFPRDLVTSHFINLYLTMVFQYLESTLHTLVVATLDMLSGCQEQPLLKYCKHGIFRGVEIFPQNDTSIEIKTRKYFCLFAHEHT